MSPHEARSARCFLEEIGADAALGKRVKKVLPVAFEQQLPAAHVAGVGSQGSQCAQGTRGIPLEGTLRQPNPHIVPRDGI